MLMYRVKPTTNDVERPQADSLKHLLGNRLNVAWDSLRADIARWSSVPPENSTIAHHIRQYDKYSQAVFQAFSNQVAQSIQVANQAGALVAAPEKVDANQSQPVQALVDNESLDATEFRSAVIGMLSARWGLLRQIALQRTPYSPYEAGLHELDAEAEHYYHRLINSLPEKLKTQPDAVRGHVAPFAPIVYLGGLAALTVYNRQVPLVLTVPMGAIDGPADPEQLGRLAIPHEIGHAILVQIPELHQELQQKLVDALEADDDEDNGARKRVLHGLITDWLEEILADMIGCALADEAYFYSSVWMLAMPEDGVGLTDKAHPPSLIRSYIHDKTLEYLENQRSVPARAAALSSLKSDVAAYDGENIRSRFLANIIGNRLERRLKVLPAVTFLTLFDVRKTLTQAVHLMLTDDRLRLSTLDNMTIGEWLTKVDADRKPTYTNTLTEWGTIPDDESKQFVLDISGGLPPDFQTPMPTFFKDTICDWFPIPVCRGS